MLTGAERKDRRGPRNPARLEALSTPHATLLSLRPSSLANVEGIFCFSQEVLPGKKKNRKKKERKGGKKSDVKIKEETDGSGATVKAEAAAVVGPVPGITVPAARSQAAAAAVTARVATAVGRPGFSPVPPAWGDTVGRPYCPYRSHLLSKHILFIPSLSPLSVS